MPASRIEQDRMRKTALSRILIGGVDIVHDDVTARPAHAFRVAAVIGRAIDRPAARLDAALLGNAQDRLVRMGYCRPERDQDSQGDRFSGNLHGEPPNILAALTLPDRYRPSILMTKAGLVAIRGIIGILQTRALRG